MVFIFNKLFWYSNIPVMYSSSVLSFILLLTPANIIGFLYENEPSVNKNFLAKLKASSSMVNI